ncbi:MAG: CvpA family protein [Oscillibacter sp.]|nr:CvpA family protein [Oscillibacter sp.]
MTEMTGFTLRDIIDIGAVLLVLVCALIGSYRGMIRMLSGLAVLILAVVGASFVTAQFTDQVTDIVTSMLESRVTGAVEEAMDGQSLSKLIGGYVETEADAALQDTLDETSFSALRFDYLSELFERLQSENKLPKPVTDSLQERFEDMRKSFTGTASQAIAKVLRDVVRPIVYGVLYVISFLVLTLVLKIVFSSLDTVKAIPGLRSVNAAGGLVLGLIQGIVFVTVAAFLLRFVFADVEGVSDSRALKVLSLFFPALSFR